MNTPSLTFEEADKLCDAILNLLEECGTEITREIELNVLECLAWNQYILNNDGYLGYWLIHPEDIDIVKARDIPQDRTTGSIVYVVQCGCKGKLYNLISELRSRVDAVGVFWHRPVKEDKVYYFPSQRGKRG